MYLLKALPKNIYACWFILMIQLISSCLRIITCLKLATPGQRSMVNVLFSIVLQRYGTLYLNICNAFRTWILSNLLWRFTYWKKPSSSIIDLYPYIYSDRFIVCIYIYLFICIVNVWCQAHWAVSSRSLHSIRLIYYYLWHYCHKESFVPIVHGRCVHVRED